MSIGRCDERVGNVGGTGNGLDTRFSSVSNLSLQLTREPFCSAFLCVSCLTGSLPGLRFNAAGAGALLPRNVELRLGGKRRSADMDEEDADAASCPGTSRCDSTEGSGM